MTPLSNWLHRSRPRKPVRTASRRGTRATLMLEALEDRVVPTFSITTSTLLTIVNSGQNYSTTIQTQGGTLASIQVSTGTLPTGVSLNSSTGDVTGTPSVSGQSKTY